MRSRAVWVRGVSSLVSFPLPVTILGAWRLHPVRSRRESAPALGSVVGWVCVGLCESFRTERKRASTCFALRSVQRERERRGCTHARLESSLTHTPDRHETNLRCLGEHFGVSMGWSEVFVVVCVSVRGVTGVIVMHGVTSQHALDMCTLNPIIPRVTPDPLYSS